MSRPIAIVTDSTADLPGAWLEEMGVTAIPLSIIWDGETHLDQGPAFREEYFRQLTGGKVLPSTSQPSPGQFAGVYRRLVDEGYDILSIHAECEAGHSC
ncbi:MAG: DegV family protein [Bacillota bacterium]